MRGWRTQRMLLRVYLFGLALLALTALTMGLLGRFLLRPIQREQVQLFAQWSLVGICAETRDPQSRSQVAERLRTHKLAGQLALYRPDGTRVWTGSPSPPAPPSPSEMPTIEEQRIASRIEHGLFFIACSDHAGERLILALGLPPPPLPSASSSLLLIAGALLLIALLAIPMARSLAAPIEALAVAARAIGNGDLSVRLNSRRRDEVGDLAHAFDEMAERIGALRRAEQELLRNISHELRTPLARVRVALDLALEGDLPRARRCLTEITRDVDELDRLLADLLLAARTDHLLTGGDPIASQRQATPISVRALIDDVSSRFTAMNPGRALRILSQTPASDGPDLHGDYRLLCRALLNLLDNASKYSEADIEIRVEQSAGTLHISVVDYGIGINPQDLPQLGQPFFRTDRSRARGTGGVGLGLALVRRVAEAHGGSLSFESPAGGGLIVHLNLPQTPGLDTRHRQPS